MRDEQRRFISSVLISVLCAALIGCGGGEVLTADPRQAAAQVDSLFGAWTTGDSPGAAVAVIRDGAIIHAAGYGLADVAEGTPITPGTAFRLASVSKQFTAMAVMILAERGQLDYDDSMVEYLPELERFGDRITIRHLLTHTGGLPDYYDALEAESPDHMPDTEEAMRFLVDWGEPLFAAGERYEYSNPGYEMLALVVERSSGQIFGEFLKQNIFLPLGMNNTVLRDSSEPTIPNRAHGYSRSDDSFELNDDHILNHIIGSGCVYSTVEDLALWDEALYTDKLVRRSTLEEAWSPVRLANGEAYPYGFGWRIGRYGGLGRRQCHSGGWVGFSTFIARYPERRFSVIVLSNLDEFEAEEYAGRIVDIYFPSTLITDARVVDGTGEPGFEADVRIEADRIVAVGELSPEKGEAVVDADGLVLAPGFIDTHSHADDDIIEYPDAVAVTSQGITTVITGQCGGSQLPLGEFFDGLEKAPAAVNIASFSGHGTIRESVMGDDFRRPATDAEIEAMRVLLRADLEAGSLGLSTGLEYDPGIYSTTDEVVELAKVAAARGGRYVSHIRSEDRRFWQAVDEILTIGRRARLPVRISHLKLAMRSSHGKTERLLGILDRAREEGIEVTADIYPYTYWQSTLTVMFPDRNFEDREAARFAIEELSSPEDMLIPDFDPDPSLAGKTLAEIAAMRGTDPATTLMDLIREAEKLRVEKRSRGENDDVESVIAKSMTESDIERLMQWPYITFCTDGELDGSHPRCFGAFPRVLGRYVRDRHVLTLEQAIHRMTALAASQHGIRDRGRIEPGAYADLVLFDPAKVIDRATTDDPHARAAGIDTVWVNGRPVAEDGYATGRKPGRVVRREPIS
jgi:N-acyl-D-aspartate/D-glutamate deacylase/CubicO group peptidase (beta-lactamase class C family)